MKTILATTAATLILGTTAYADGHTSAFSAMQFDPETNVNASDLIGMRIYASEADIENETVTINGQNDWNDIGEVNEIVLTRDGTVQSLIVGVGGFLGMGEKDVAVSMDQLQFVTEEGEIDDYFLVIKASAVGVQDAPAYEYELLTNTMSDEPEPMVEDRPMLTSPMIEREGYATVAKTDINTEDLTGAWVYGASDENIGEVAELLLTDDGKIDRAVLDIGGFLGMGEHTIAVSMDELQIMREDGGDDLRVYIESSKEALEGQPEYEG